jgi:hypothetical protein
MFAMKSMDKESALLKLKLDLVYRDLAIEEAQKRFDELNVVVPEAPAAEAVAAPPPVVAVKAAPKKKVIKALVPAGVPGAAPAKRTMSDEARAAASERMKKRWADKNAEIAAHRAAIAPKAVLPAPK